MTAVIIVLIAVLLIAGAVFVFAAAVFESSFTRVKKPLTTDEGYIKGLESSGIDTAPIREGLRWFDSRKKEDLYITSRDGLKLHAFYIPADGPTDRLAVLVHGYHGCPAGDFSSILREWHDRGFDLLLPDQRTHGASEGRYITFGFSERYDIVDWCRYVLDAKGERKVLLSGISMGCTTVLLAAAEPDMPGLTYILADCGYTSPLSIFTDVVKSRYHLPAFPAVNAAELICRLRAGFGFSDFDTREAVKHLRAPVTFVHGEADDFVAPRNTLENHAACTAPKELITVPGAGHGMSYLVDTPRLTAETDRIVSQYFS